MINICIFVHCLESNELFESTENIRSPEFCQRYAMLCLRRRLGPCKCAKIHLTFGRSILILALVDGFALIYEIVSVNVSGTGSYYGNCTPEELKTSLDAGEKFSETWKKDVAFVKCQIQLQTVWRKNPHQLSFVK